MCYHRQRRQAKSEETLFYQRNIFISFCRPTGDDAQPEAPAPFEVERTVFERDGDLGDVTNARVDDVA